MSEGKRCLLNTVLFSFTHHSWSTGRFIKVNDGVFISRFYSSVHNDYSSSSIWQRNSRFSSSKASTKTSPAKKNKKQKKLRWNNGLKLTRHPNKETHQPTTWTPAIGPFHDHDCERPQTKVGEGDGRVESTSTAHARTSPGTRTCVSRDHALAGARHHLENTPGPTNPGGFSFGFFFERAGAVAGRQILPCICRVPERAAFQLYFFIILY